MSSQGQRSIKARIKELKRNEPTDDLWLSDDFARLMQESSTVTKLIDGDLNYTPDLEATIREQCISQGLDPACMIQELKAALECEGCLLFRDMGPVGQVMTFLSSKRLGPHSTSLKNKLIHDIRLSSYHED